MGKIERDKGMSQLDYLWTYYGGYIIKKEDDQDNPQYFLLTENQIDDKIKNNTQSIFQNLPIKEVSSSYFIKNDNGTIKSSISLVYKSNLIQLIGLDNQVISTIDASSFIKDGMVNNVQLITNPQGQAEGTYIVITFNTDSGLEPIYLNVTQLIDIYVGGNGISIQNNQVLIKLDASSEEYLSISENGIKISGIKQIQETLPQVYNSLQDIELSSNFNTNKLYIDSSKSQIYIYKDNNLVLLKGLKGDPLTFDDLTEEQIAELQKPATEAISLATQAAQNAQTSAQNADNATQKATQAISDIQSVQTQFQQKEQEWQTAEAIRQDNETKRVTAENARVTEFSQIQSTANSLIEETTTAKNNTVEATTNANKATENANTATEKANSAAASANEAAAAANQAAQNVDGRVTTLEEKASQVYDNLAAIQASGETNPNKIYIDGETLIPYVYKGGEFVPFSGTIDDSNYVKRIDGQVPIRGIRYIDTSIWPNCTKMFNNVFYDENTETIYCMVQGTSVTGGIAKIQKDKIIAKLGMDTYDAPCESAIVKIGNYIYAIQFGWNWAKQIVKIDDSDFSVILRVTHQGIISINTVRNGLFVINENLYLWGIDHKLYLVNKDDLSLSEPIFENLQYVLWFDKQRLVIADDTSIFEFTGGTEKINQNPIPEGFESIRQLSSSQNVYNTTNGALIYIRSGNKLTIYYTANPSNYANLKNVNNIIFSKWKIGRIYSVRKLYNIPANHDFNAYRDSLGILYYDYKSSANFSGSPYITADALGLNIGPYLIGDTPIYPTYKGFLM